MKYGIIVVAIDTQSNAKKLASLLLEKRLAGCIQLLPIQSHYLWRGKQETSSEVLMLIKTHIKKYKTIEKVVKENHPYQVPEILFVPAKKIFTPYQKWLDESLQEE